MATTPDSAKREASQVISRHGKSQTLNQLVREFEQILSTSAPTEQRNSHVAEPFRAIINTFSAPR